jgi:hypothetical protein
MHAAGLHNRYQDVEVLQLDPAADAITQLHPCPLIAELISPDQTIALFMHHRIH